MSGFKSGIRRGLIFFVVVEQDPVRRSVKIGILPALQTPDKRQKPDKPEQKRNRYEVDHNAHARHLIRNELRMTTKEDPDMAAAASIGVKKPSAATGMATPL